MVTPAGTPTRPSRPLPSTSPPWLREPERWMSVQDFARLYRRSPITVRRWCRTGYLLDFGISIYCDISGRYWLRIDQ